MMTNRNEYGTFEVARPSDDATGTLADLGLAPLEHQLFDLLRAHSPTS